MATLGNVMRRIKRDLRAKNGLRLSDDDVEDAINDAIRHYRSRRFTFNEANAENGLAPTITTVIGTTGYPYPTAMLELDEVIYLYSGYNYPLIQWNWIDQVAAVGDTTSARGPGRYFAIHGNMIHLFPPANEATTVTLTGLIELTPAPLRNSLSENAWTTEALPLIRARASWDLSLNVMANPDRAADFKTAENDALSSLQEETWSKLATGQAFVNDWEHV